MKKVIRGIFLLGTLVILGACSAHLSKKELSKNNWVAYLEEDDMKMSLNFSFSDTTMSMKPKLEEANNQEDEENEEDDLFGGLVEDTAKSIVEKASLNLKYELKDDILTLQQPQDFENLFDVGEGSFRVSKDKGNLVLKPLDEKGKDTTEEALVLQPVK